MDKDNPENYRGFTENFAKEFVEPQIRFWADNVYQRPPISIGLEAEYYDGMLRVAQNLLKIFSPPYRGDPRFPFHEVILDLEELEILKGIIGDNHRYLTKKIKEKREISSKFLNTSTEEKQLEHINFYLNHIAPTLLDSLTKELFVPFVVAAKQGKKESVSVIDREYDVFISHASEDKPYVEKLASTLKNAGVKVWYDSYEMQWGDDLRNNIDRGLANSKYGIVIFSKTFLGKKKWTEYELNGLFAREGKEGGFILPIWHDVTREDLLQYGPTFADRLAKQSDKDTPEQIVEDLKKLLGK